MDLSKMQAFVGRRVQAKFHGVDVHGTIVDVRSVFGRCDVRVRIGPEDGTDTGGLTDGEFNVTHWTALEGWTDCRTGKGARHA